MAHRNKKLTSASFSAGEEKRMPFMVKMTLDDHACEQTQSSYTIPEVAREIKRIAVKMDYRTARDLLKQMQKTVHDTLQNPSTRNQYKEIDPTPLDQLETWLNERILASGEEEKIISERHKLKESFEKRQLERIENQVKWIADMDRFINSFQHSNTYISYVLRQKLLSYYPRDEELSRIEDSLKTGGELSTKDALVSLHKHPLFWSIKEFMYEVANAGFADEKEVKIPASFKLTVAPELIKESLDLTQQYYAGVIKSGDMGLPFNKKDRREFLHALYMENHLRNSEQYNLADSQAIKHELFSFAKKHTLFLTEDEVSCSIFETMKEFYSKQCSEGDAFSICYAFANSYVLDFDSFFYDRHPHYRLDVIEMLCTLTNYCLQKTARGKLGFYAARYYNCANDFFEKYRETLTDKISACSPIESRIVEYFYYTQIRMAYHGSMSIKQGETHSVNFIHDPLFSLDQYQNFVRYNPVKFQQARRWMVETKLALNMPVRSRPKQILPIAYGAPYVPISYAQQQENFINEKKSALATLGKYRSKNLVELKHTFALFDGPEHPFLKLEKMIKRTCDNQHDFFSSHLLQTFVTIAVYTFTQRAAALEKYKNSISQILKEKEEVAFAKETKLPAAPKKVSATKSTRSQPADMQHIKEINKRDETEKASILAAANAVEIKGNVEKKETPKAKKKKRNHSAGSSKTKLTPPVSTYVPIESKLTVSANRSAPILKKKFKISEPISPEIVLKDILSLDSCYALMDFFEMAPLTINKDRLLSNVGIGGSLALIALAQCLQQPLGFKPNDIDLHCAQSKVGRGIFDALKQHHFSFKSSARNLFTQYISSNYMDEIGKIVPCELTIIPSDAKKSINSIPLSQIKIVVEKEKHLLYFTDVTAAMLEDIANRIFRVEIPSVAISDAYESHFLMRFSNYYFKLVIMSGWTVDLHTTQMILKQDFLTRYMTKLRTYSTTVFHLEISRLLMLHQKILFSLNAAELSFGRQLINTVLSPIIQAFFSNSLKSSSEFRADSDRCLPELTKQFLEYFQTTPLAALTERQSHTDWLLQLMTSFGKIAKSDGLIFDLSAIVNNCCIQIATDSTLRLTRSLFRDSASSSSSSMSSPAPASLALPAI